MNYIEPVLFNQGDKAWGDVMYSSHEDRNQTIRTSGAAPTLCADIVATMKDESVTPVTLAELAAVFGCRTYNSGTTWDFYGRVATYYGFHKFVQSRRFEDVIQCIESGGYAICAMKEGFWGKHGMLVLPFFHDGTNIFAYNGNARRGKQSTKDFKREMRMCFCYYPNEKDADSER